MTITAVSHELFDPATLAGGGNAILSHMSRADLNLIAPWCTRSVLRRGAVIVDANEAIDGLYFIEDGIASVIKPQGQAEKTEVALIGPESFVGAPLVLGDGHWPYRVFVQVDRLSAIRLPADRFLEAIDRSPTLGRLLARAVHTQMIQIAEALVSAVWQRLDARLARWLLMYRDRLRSDRLEVTHEFMAMMVGAQRTGVTAALHDLEGDGMITASRGLVIIRDPAALARLADGGYGVPEREHARLFPRRVD